MKIKHFIFFSILAFVLVFSPKKVEAANVIPSCGNDFDSAVELNEGNNTGGVINDGDTCYYYINTKAGYELDVDYKLTGEYFFGSVSLYDNEQNEIAASVEGEDILKWLGSSSEQLKYYLVLDNSYKTDSQIINIGLVDRTDANSGADAGNDFDNAKDIEYGEYTGYLSSFVYGAEGGNDESDYYKLSINKGDEITVRVTPTGDFEVGCAVYDSGRSELFNEEGLDLEGGAIIQKTFDIESNGYIYIVIKQAAFGENDNRIDQYNLLVTNENVDNLGGEIGSESEGQDSEDQGINIGVPPSTKDIIIKIFWVVLIVFVLALIVFLIFSLSKKKGQKKQKDTSSGNTSKPKPKVSPQSAEKSTSEEDNLNKVRVTVEEGTDVEVKTVDADKTNEPDK